jgi:small GTP-binding protein
MFDEPQAATKVVFVGESGAGKTSIISAYSSGSFTSGLPTTIGAACVAVTVRYEDRDVKFAVWDTAGQEFYHSLTPMYYRNAKAAVVVFDLTSTASFRGAEAWVQELQSSVEGVVIVLCGNKSDLQDRRAVAPDEAMGLAQQLELPYVETSATAGTGLDDLFQIVAKVVLDTGHSEIEASIELKQWSDAQKKDNGCC